MRAWLLKPEVLVCAPAHVEVSGISRRMHGIVRAITFYLRRCGVDLGQRKEQFSVAYLHAVASVAGCRTSSPSVDDDSVDWYVKARGPHGRRRSPQVDLQLKCTERVDSRNGSFAFPLSIKNYNDLRGDDLHVPRILVVVFVPNALELWLDQSEERLLMKYCAYWVSLRDAPETANSTSVSVSLPRANQFTVDAFKSMVRKIGDGETP